jgi:hypothetical protein
VKATLICDEGNDKQLYVRRDTREKTVKESREHLKDKILFIDEASPPTNVNSESMNNGLNRLQFLRNIGRLLSMKVVSAGTSAVAANMICQTSAVASNSSNPTTATSRLALNH